MLFRCHTQDWRIPGTFQALNFTFQSPGLFWVSGLNFFTFQSRIIPGIQAWNFTFQRPRHFQMPRSWILHFKLWNISRWLGLEVYISNSMTFPGVQALKFTFQTPGQFQMSRTCMNPVDFTDWKKNAAQYSTDSQFRQKLRNCTLRCPR